MLRRVGPLPSEFGDSEGGIRRAPYNTTNDCHQKITLPLYVRMYSPVCFSFLGWGGSRMLSNCRESLGIWGLRHFTGLGSLASAYGVITCSYCQINCSVHPGKVGRPASCPALSCAVVSRCIC